MKRYIGTTFGSYNLPGFKCVDTDGTPLGYTRRVSRDGEIHWHWETLSGERTGKSITRQAAWEALRQARLPAVEVVPRDR